MIKPYNTTVTLIQMPKGEGIKCSTPEQCPAICTCGDKSDWIKQLSDLECMEGFLEFARTLREDPDAVVRGSGWSQEDKWRELIAKLRDDIPNCFLMIYDSERRKSGDRPDCDCALCIEAREGDDE